MNCCEQPINPDMELLQAMMKGKEEKIEKHIKNHFEIAWKIQRGEGPISYNEYVAFVLARKSYNYYLSSKPPRHFGKWGHGINYRPYHYPEPPKEKRIYGKCVWTYFTLNDSGSFWYYRNYKYFVRDRKGKLHICHAFRPKGWKSREKGI